MICLEDVFQTCLQDVLKRNNCLLGYFSHRNWLHHSVMPSQMPSYVGFTTAKKDHPKVFHTCGLSFQVLKCCWKTFYGLRNEGSLWNENLMGFSWLFFNCTRECLCPMFLLWAFTFRRNCLEAIWNRVEAALLPKGARVTLKQTF